MGSYTLRDKYFQARIQQELRNTLISEAVFRVDRAEPLKRIQNPYLTGVAAAIQAVAGTYTPATRTTNEDALTVTEESVVGTHIFDFERRTSNFDLTAAFLDDIAYQVAYKIEYYTLNKILDDATTTYSTPAGGFTAANTPVIVTNLLGKIAGYQGVSLNQTFLVIENTDLAGFMQAQTGLGFNYSDSVLNNGFIRNFLGVDVYVVRTGTFATATIGTLTAVNSGHRLFGPKGVATYASPASFVYEEKGVTGKTGMEIAGVGYCGAKAWAPVAALFVDITLA